MRIINHEPIIVNRSVQEYTNSLNLPQHSRIENFLIQHFRI